MKKMIDFIDKPENIKKMRRIFHVCLVVLVLLDVITSIFISKHPHFIWEKIPGFSAVYGFIACALIIIVSKALGKWGLMKPENYYD